MKWQQTPRVLDSSALTPLVFSMLWGELGCSPWLHKAQQPWALPRSAVVPPQALVLSTAPNPSKTQVHSCSCAGPASQSRQKQPVRWGFPQILSLHGCAVSVAAPWRGHPRAASPESTISVHHGYTQLSSQVNRGHQQITGGWFERKARRGHSPCRLGWTPSLFSSQSFHAEEALPGAHAPLSQVWPSPLQRVEPSSRMLWLPVPHQCCLTALPRSQQCWELWGKLIMLLFVPINVK